MYTLVIEIEIFVTASDLAHEESYVYFHSRSASSGLQKEAYLTIQRQSRQRRKFKKEIAEAIILGDELRRGKNPSHARS